MKIGSLDNYTYFNGIGSRRIERYAAVIPIVKIRHPVPTPVADDRR